MSRHVCIIFDHPYTASSYDNEPHNRSLSAAILHKLVLKHKERNNTVDIIDLHSDGFDPIMHKEDLVAWRKKISIDPLVLNYQKRLLEADEIVFIFPIWWELMPAMTKGFLDKVFAKGVLYDEPQKGALFTTKLLNLKSVKMVTVMATPSFIYRFIFGNPIVKAVFRGTFRKMGIKELKWFNFSATDKKTSTQRSAIIEKKVTKMAV